MKFTKITILENNSKNKLVAFEIKNRCFPFLISDYEGKYINETWDFLKKNTLMLDSNGCDEFCITYHCYNKNWYKIIAIFWWICFRIKNLFEKIKAKILYYKYNKIKI